MRVLHLTNMYPAPEDPAYGVFVKSQIESLKVLGVDLDVEIIRGSRSKLDYLKAIRRIRRLAKSGDHDLIHAHYGLAGFVAVQQRQKAVCISFCGSDLLGIPNAHGRATAKGHIHAALSRFAARRATKVILQSAAMAAALGTERDYDVIPYGVDFDLFKPGAQSYARAQLNLTDDRPRVLFVGRSGKGVKRQWLAQEAMERLQQARPDIELYAMEGRSQADVALAMNACQCLLITSSHEGSPNVVKEAMACNLPVVSTPVGDVEVLFGNTPGHYVTEDVSESLAHNLEKAVGFGRTQGRAQIEHLSCPNIAKRVLELYDELS